MSFKKNVLVYGSSLILARIAAYLDLDESLGVRFVDPHDSQAKQSLDEFEPETILFDLTGPPDDLDMALQQQRPGLLLIGVDPSSDEVFFLKGQRRRVVTAGGLTQLVSNHTGDTQVNQGL